LLALFTGALTGIGALIFRNLIGLLHNLFFLARLSPDYDAKLHTPPSPWGPFVILVPVLGAVGVSFLVKNFAPEAKGHGVPEVIDAIYFQNARIRPIVAVIKSIASALSIGTGGSVGREGPIVQIGSAIGSTVGEWLQLINQQRITLIAAGAGAGIAATFNTPIGGVLFAAELLLHEISVWTFVPVILATACAAYIGQIFFGTAPAFDMPRLATGYFHLTDPAVLICSLGLGLLMGLVSALFIKTLYFAEDHFESPFLRNYYVRHVVGMLVVGSIFYLLMHYLGHYYIQGVGYATIQDILTGSLSSASILVLLFFLKLAVTSLTIGSGGSGGIFSPSLFLGATMGGAYGLVLNYLFPSLHISPSAFAVVGMAAVVAGTTGAALTAIVMIFEMTLDYGVILPITLAVAASLGTRKLLTKETIYTMKLSRRGHNMTLRLIRQNMSEPLQTNVIDIKRAAHMMRDHFILTAASSIIGTLSETLSTDPTLRAIVTQDTDGTVRVLSRESAQHALDFGDPNAQVSQVSTTPFAVISEDTPMAAIIEMARSNPKATFLVANGGTIENVNEIRGIITSEQILEALTHYYIENNTD